jgi:hypothetical protein
MDNVPLKTKILPHVESKDMSEFERFLKEYELDRLHTDFLSRWVTLIVASLSLITALAWDDLFKYLFVSFFGHLNEVSQKVLYSVILTVATVLVTLILGKMFLKKGKKEIEKQQVYARDH